MTFKITAKEKQMILKRRKVGASQYDVQYSLSDVLNTYDTTLKNSLLSIMRGLKPALALDSRAKNRLKNAITHIFESMGTIQNIWDNYYEQRGEEGWQERQMRRKFL